MKKECFKCEKIKSLSDFYSHKQMKDGHLNKCKQCAKDDEKNRRNSPSSREKILAYDRARSNNPDRAQARLYYSKTENGKLAGTKAKKKWIANNKLKRLANQVVNNAIQRGQLAKSYVCEQCNKTASRIHGHHDDYAFPLVVRWLCPKCHTKWHKENGEGKNA